MTTSSTGSPMRLTCAPSRTPWPSASRSSARAAQVRDKIEELEAAGVTQVCLYLSIVEPDRHFSTLETYGREIIPAFR